MDTTVPVVHGSYTLEYNCHIHVPLPQCSRRADSGIIILQVVPLIFELVIVQLVINSQYSQSTSHIKLFLAQYTNRSVMWLVVTPTSLSHRAIHKYAVADLGFSEGGFCYYAHFWSFWRDTSRSICQSIPFRSRFMLSRAEPNMPAKFWE